MAHQPRCSTARLIWFRELILFKLHSESATVISITTIQPLPLQSRSLRLETPATTLSKQQAASILAETSIITESTKVNRRLTIPSHGITAASRSLLPVARSCATIPVLLSSDTTRRQHTRTSSPSSSISSRLSSPSPSPPWLPQRLPLIPSPYTSPTPRTSAM